jgi:hypothetical protein
MDTQRNLQVLCLPLGLEKSIFAGKFVPEEEYEVLGDEASDRPSIPSIARKLVQSKASDVLYVNFGHNTKLMTLS